LDELAHSRPRTTFAVIFALFFVLLGAWAAATPLGDTPDEWAHVFRASGVISGQIDLSDSRAVDPLGGDSVRVPAELAARAGQTGCYAFHPETPVTCAVDPPAPADATVVVKTAAGRYPPLYYAAVGWPLALGSGAVNLYLCRLVAVVLSSAFLALGALCALRLRSRWVLAGYLVGMVPMTTYIGAMINPNGLEITSGAALWPSLLLWLRGDSPQLRRSGLTAATAAAATMVLVRPASILWLAVALVSVAILARRRWWRTDVLRPGALLRIGIVAAAMVAVGIWAVSVRMFDIASIQQQQAPYTAWVKAALHWQWWRIWGMQSVAEMGWLDTPVETIMYQLAACAVVVLIIAGAIGAARGRWRHLTSAVIAAGLTLGVTILMAAGQANTMGLGFWQGRYSLPMAVGVPLLFAYAAPRTRRSFPVIATVVAVCTLFCVVQTDAFLRFFHRNSIGLTKPFAWTGGWQPPLGIVTWLVVLLFGVVGLSGMAIAAAVGPQRSDEVPRADPHADTSVSPQPALAD
jgi:hypothetical protein